MKLKKLIFLVIYLSCTCSVYAAKYITVHLNNGTKLSFVIANNPKITIMDGKFSIGTEHLLISGINKYTFGNEDESTTISHIKESGLTYYPNPTKDFIYIKTAKDTQLSLYSLSGIELPVKAKRKDNLIMLDLRDFRNDIYLLKVGKETLKIQKQ